MNRVQPDSDGAAEGGGGVGIFGAVVWPTYLGASTGHPGGGPNVGNEPSDSPDYERGQIDWQMENGEIVGRATLKLPAGTYEYLVFCHGPTGTDLMIDFSKFEHPLTFDRAGIVDVYPINNTAVLPRGG